MLKFKAKEVFIMIINRLSILLVERNIKASKLSVDTGIAKSTLTKITNNNSIQIDYLTLNKICNYLKVTPNDFFDYSPYDIDFFTDIEEVSTDFDPNSPSVPFTKKIEINLFLKLFHYGKDFQTIEYVFPVEYTVFPNEEYSTYPDVDAQYNGYTPIDINGLVFANTDYKQKEILLLNTLSVAMQKNINDSAKIAMGKAIMDYLEEEKYIFTENISDSNLNGRYIDRSDIVEIIKRDILLYVNVLEDELPF